MGIFDIFKKDKPPEPDPLRDATLENMQPDWLVDYDLKTWEVKARHAYDWGEGDITHEWQLVAGDQVVYLEKEADDVEDWSLNWKIDFNLLGPEVRRALKETGDPPNEVQFQEVTYYQEEMAGGHFLKHGQRPGQELLRWGFENEAGDSYLCIEQWGEDVFEAFAGKPVFPYQFTDILPRRA